MTSQPKSDGHGRHEPAEATAARRQVSDTLAKSYRYLRLAMVGLLLCLAVSVVIQSWRQGDLLFAPLEREVIRQPVTTAA